MPKTFESDEVRRQLNKVKCLEKAFRALLEFLMLIVNQLALTLSEGWSNNTPFSVTHKVDDIVHITAFPCIVNNMIFFSCDGLYLNPEVVGAIGN